MQDYLKPKMESKGFALVEVLVIVLLIGILAGGYWIKKNQTVSIPQPTIQPSSYSPTQPVITSSTTTSKTDETANWKTYRNVKYGFSITYPQNWYAKEYGNFSLLFGEGVEPKEIPPLTHPWGNLDIEISKTAYF